MSAGIIDRDRAAASSIASGMPSSRSQICTSASAWSVQSTSSRRASGPAHEQLCGIADGHRNHPANLFSGHAQRLARSSDHAGRHRRRSQLDDQVGDLIDQMLAVVEHDDHRPRRERIFQRDLERFPGPLRDLTCGGDRQGRSAPRCEAARAPRTRPLAGSGAGCQRRPGRPCVSCPPHRCRSGSRAGDRRHRRRSTAPRHHAR